MNATTSDTKPYIVSREFDAPRDLVWKASTEPERMAKWFAPKGFTTEVKRMDLRPGGMCLYCQRSPDGAEMWGRVVYREVTPQDRIVQIQSFSDPEGNIGTHPMAPTWPKEMHSVYTFEDLGGRRTRLTIEWTPYNASAEEAGTFDAARAGMDGGWKGTLDNLESYLAGEQH